MDYPRALDSSPEDRGLGVRDWIELNEYIYNIELNEFINNKLNIYIINIELNEFIILN